MKYPIAETFRSIQGEGLYTGTPMFFVRLAGCPVGKPPTEDELEAMRTPLFRELGTHPPLLPLFNAVYPGHTLCQDMLGHKFLCDTNYRVTAQMTIEDILDLIPVATERVCLTGGEPYAYDLRPLMHALVGQGFQVHVETSGALPIVSMASTWVACSPKRGFQVDNGLRVSEFKFLVGGTKRTPEERVREIRFFLSALSLPRPVPVFLQPINRLDVLWKEHVAFAVEMLKLAPEWRLSIQLHKVLGVR